MDVPDAVDEFLWRDLQMSSQLHGFHAREIPTAARTLRMHIHAYRSWDWLGKCVLCNRMLR